MNVPPGKQLTIYFRHGSEIDRTNYKKYQTLFLTLAKVEQLEWLDEKTTPPESASAFVESLEIYIPLAGLINKAEETLRLQKEIGKIEKEVIRAQAKLNNPSFVDKAPPNVVEQEKQRLQEFEATLEKLQLQLKKLG